MVHLHRPLRDRMQREVRVRDLALLERRVPERQRIEIGLDALAVLLGRLDGAVAARGEAELLQRLAIELQHDLLDLVDQAHALRGLEIALVGVLVVELVVGQVIAPEALVLDIAVELLRVHRPGPLLVAARTAPAGERADAGLALVVDEVVRIAARIARAAIGIGEARQFQPRAELDQDVLERPHVAVGLEHRLADRVGRPLGRADRPVEQRDAVPALEIGRVGQHEIGIRHHLREVRVGIDDARDLVAAVRLLVGQHGDRAGGVHRRVPRHVRHVHEQRVDLVRIAAQALRITMCIRPWAASGASHE